MYIVVCPDYRHNSAGIRALHRLAALINASGEAAMVTGRPDPTSTNVQYRPGGGVNASARVVYPEGPKGNALGAQHVTRWILAPNCQGKEWGSNDYLTAWSAAYTAHASEQLGRVVEDVLQVDLIERFFFLPPERTRRAGTLYYKAAPEAGTKNYTFITDEWPGTREELAALFRKSELFVCGDPMTLLAMEAAVCGCPVRITRPNPNPAQYEAGYAGFAFPGEPIERARETVRQAEANYRTWASREGALVRNFLEKTAL